METVLQIRELAGQLPEIYQPIYLNKNRILEGRRDCYSRWKTIKKQIKPHDTVFDVGSSLGYFSHKIAETYPDSLVISFESDPIMCEIQKLIYQHEGIYNVVVCNTRLSADDLYTWSKLVEFVDVGLFLSVLHHYPTEDVDKLWHVLRNMFNRVIMEIPELEETEACGQATKDKWWSTFHRKIWHIGKAKSHLGKYDRKMLGMINKRNLDNLDAFWGVDHPDRHKHAIKSNKLNGRNIVRGVNLWNLCRFNIVWPDHYWFQKQSIHAYYSLIDPHDIRPWNLLVTSTGLKTIDFIDQLDQDDDFTKLIAWFEHGMKPEWE